MVEDSASIFNMRKITRNFCEIVLPRNILCTFITFISDKKLSTLVKHKRTFDCFLTNGTAERKTHLIADMTYQI